MAESSKATPMVTVERIILRLSLLLFVVHGANCFVTIAAPVVVHRQHASSSRSSSRILMAKDATDLSDVGIVLLAGGKGSRMKANVPKQFLELQGVPILHHSLNLFLERLPDAVTNPPAHVVLVMDPFYQKEYQPIIDRYKGRISFATPGVERQGSVENGLNQLRAVVPTCQYAAIHDSARPLVTIPEILNVVRDAKKVGAAVLGVPCKATIKEASADGEMVLRTLPRARLWEVHTPQVIQIDLLQRGFAKVRAEALEVTDDVSIVEQLNEPVKLTRGEYTNLKITTPEDMDVAAAILEERKSPVVALLL